MLQMYLNLLAVIMPFSLILTAGIFLALVQHSRG